MDIHEVRRHQLTVLVKEAGGNVRLAERCGLKNPEQVSHWLRKVRNIGGTNARKVEAGMGKPRGWLDHLEPLTQEQGPSLPQKNVDPARSVFFDQDRLLRPPRANINECRYEIVQLLDVRAGMGDGIHNELEEVSGGIAFQTSWLIREGLSSEKCRAILGVGDSMAPTMNDGDVLLVDITRCEPVSGKVFAFRTPDGVKAKRLRREFIGGGWVICSDNPNKIIYPDEAIPAGIDMHIIGRVVWRGGVV